MEDVERQLVCVDIRQETHDVRTFTFRAADGQSFAFSAGQYLRFAVEVQDEPLSRCYSASSSPLRPGLVSVTVKRVEGGVVSNWLHDQLAVGGRLQAVGPTGQFVLPEAAVHGPLLLVSGGSGITPVMSMLRGLADAHQYPDIVFLHAARTPADLVFRAELEYRAKVTPNLRVIFLPERDDGSGHIGVLGRISDALLQVAVPDLATRTVMCCGPAPFMNAVRQVCTHRGVVRYIEESFGGAPADTAAATTPPVANAEGSASFKVTFAKQGKTLDVQADQTVLSAARQGGLKLPTSCGNGVCGTCKSKLLSGQVNMKHEGGIRQREVDAGFFLPCCSKPLSELVIDR
jgi:glycine betaine catabolism B